MKEVKTIFIVDDDPTQVMMLEDHLSKFKHFNIKSFISGEECLKNLFMKPDIIFLDYYFDSVDKKAMNGIDVLKKIKQTHPDTEVVMFSGQDKIEVAVNTIKYGAFDYIVKNESAFLRSENVIFNIIRKLKLEGSAKLYKKLTYLFAVALALVIITIFILNHFGLITTNPGWM